MNELQTGIFVPQAILNERLRILQRIAGCSYDEAVGKIVRFWMEAAELADERGFVGRDHVEKMDSGELEVFELSGLVQILPDGGLAILDFMEAVQPARRLKEHDDKLDKKRHLDMVRKQKRRAELKAQTVQKAPEVVVQPVLSEPVVIPAAEAEKPAEPQKAEKKPKAKKEAPEKIKYDEFVSMTQAEHDKLVEEYGELATAEFIKVLGNYKGSRNKKYASDYRAILTWVVDRVKERNPGILRQSKPKQAAVEATNPFDDNPF